MKLIVAFFLLFLGSKNTGAQSARQDLPKFMGRELTISEPQTDEEGFFPKGPASVCI